MHSESELRRLAKTLLEQYGKLTTHEMILLMEQNINFDEEDLEPNPNRKFKNRFPDGEPLVYQRIRNIALRPRVGELRIYIEGFAIDRRGDQIYWVATEGLTNEEKVISNKKINSKRARLSNKKRRKNRGVKIDWNMINERRTDLGARGEEFVYNTEKEKVMTFSPDSVDKVIHTSVIDGDGLGYDIISINQKGQTIYIEVKTTKGDLNTPFYMSINEKQFLEENENAFLYRVYNFDENTRHGLIKTISSKKFLKYYIFDPVSFKVCKNKLRS